MKIVFGSDSFLPVLQGVTTHIVLYAKKLVEVGHTVLIVASEYPDYIDEDLGHGITIARIKSYSVGEIFKIKHVEDRLINPFKKGILDPILDEFQPDIIHCHTEFAMGRALLSYSKKNKIPIAMTAHIYFEYYMQFYFPKLPKFLCRFIAKSIQYHFFKHAQLLISPTVLMKTKLQSYGIKQDTQIIPTGMVLSDFTIQNPQELLDFKEEYPVFKENVLLFVGRIVAEKNVEFLLDAFIELVKTKPELNLVYVGKGIKQNELIKKAKAKGVEDKVHFYSPVPREKLKYFYHSCRLFTFPSLGETQGLVALEAMCSGKPVIGIDAMGVGETMEHRNYGGLISNPYDLNAYIANILLLLSDQELYNQKAKEAYEIAKRWSIEPLYEKLEVAYIKLFEDFGKKI